MVQIQAAFMFLVAHWGLIAAIAGGLGSVVSTIATANTNHPNAETWLHRIQGALSWVEHADVGSWKWPLATLKRPTVGQPVTEDPTKPIKMALFLALFLAGPARAQVFSAGASLPMLEFASDKLHPVQFAPGLGVDGAVGLFQFAALGKSWDALDLSIQLFGNAPGAFQAAALVGTLNNLIAIGVAVPLATTDGAGAFQGVWKAYPILSLSVPIAFGPFSPPVGTEQGPKGLVRGGTLFFGAP